MRLLIPVFSPPTGTWGGLTRVIALADAARQADCAVAFCASGPVEMILRQRGYEVHSTPPPTMFGLPPPASRLMVRFSQRVSLPVRSGRPVGDIWKVLVARGFGRALYLRNLVDAERRAAIDFGADMLFTDVDPGAMLLAAISGMPLAANYAAVATAGTGSWSWQVMRRAANRVLAHHGKPPRSPDELCFNPSVLKIIPSIPELDGTPPDRPDVCYVGHMLGDLHPAARSEFRPDPAKRYVFAYLGTGSIPLRVLRTVLPRVFPADGNAVCLVGAQSMTRACRIGAVEFRPYVPAESLVANCDWVLCHGGQNTIIQSLRHGVPLVLFPGPVFERRFNARKVQETGAGIVGETDQFTVDWLRVTRIRQAGCAIRAAALGERIRSYGGAEAALEAMNEWLGRHRPRKGHPR